MTTTSAVKSGTQVTITNARGREKFAVEVLGVEVNKGKEMYSIRCSDSDEPIRVSASRLVIKEEPTPVVSGDDTSTEPSSFDEGSAGGDAIPTDAELKEMVGYTPSAYQKRIIDWVFRGTGNGIINAVAGSGKSSTLLLTGKAFECVGILPSNVLLTAFNRHNVKELQSKFPPNWKDSIKTVNSIGYAILRQHLDLPAKSFTLNKQKYRDIAVNLGYIADPRFDGSRGNLKGTIKDSDFLGLIDLLRANLLPPTAKNVELIVNQWGIEDVLTSDCDKIAIAARTCLRIGEEQAKGEEWAEGEEQAEVRKGKSIIDFEDQIYLPVLWGANPHTMPRYLLIDESQDLTPAQAGLIQLIANASAGCRVLAVGDPFQAIMGFAGADAESFYKLKEITNATELPLSICFRCPSSHIELVQNIFPKIPIEAAPSAIEGTIHKFDKKGFLEGEDSPLKAGDLILSRRTAPLVSLCLSLLARGIPAKVRGSDVADVIIRELNAIARQRGFEFKKYHLFAEQYQKSKNSKYHFKNNGEELIQLLQDKLDCLSAIYDGNNFSTKEEMIEFIKGLFADSDEGHLIWLSTIHRAKGLQARRVFIIDTDKLPLTRKNQLDWQYDQELNLLYVALTRATEELWIETINRPWWIVGMRAGDGPEVKPSSDDETLTSESASLMEEMPQDGPIFTESEIIPPSPAPQIEIPAPPESNVVWIPVKDLWPKQTDLDADPVARRLQPRKGLNNDTVSKYALLLAENPLALPPIDVFLIGGVHTVASGFHRLAAHIENGAESVPVCLHYGTMEEAIAFASMSNADHPLPLALPEMKEAVRNLLRVKEFLSESAIDAMLRAVRNKFPGSKTKELSNKTIGLLMGCAPKTVDRVAWEVDNEKLMSLYQVGDLVRVSGCISERTLPVVKKIIDQLGFLEAKVTEKGEYTLTCEPIDPRFARMVQGPFAAFPKHCKQIGEGQTSPLSPAEFIPEPRMFVKNFWSHITGIIVAADDFWGIDRSENCLRYTTPASKNAAVWWYSDERIDVCKLWDLMPNDSAPTQCGPLPAAEKLIASIEQDIAVREDNYDKRILKDEVDKLRKGMGAVFGGSDVAEDIAEDGPGDDDWDEDGNEQSGDDDTAADNPQTEDSRPIKDSPSRLGSLKKQLKSLKLSPQERDELVDFLYSL